MGRASLSSAHLFIAGSAIVALYAVGAVGEFVPAMREAARLWTNPESTAPEGPVELLEAVLWILAAGGFIHFAVLSFQAGHSDVARHEHRQMAIRCLWGAFFAGLTFLAAGEELSWGQHFGLVAPSAAWSEINFQHEANVHNLNIAKIIGIAPDHPLAAYLSDFGSLLNPAFSVFWLLALVVVPWGIQRHWRGLRNRLFAAYPLPTRPLLVFFLVNFVLWIVIDRLLFDAGEIFEFTLALSALLAAYEDVRLSLERRKGAMALGPGGRTSAPLRLGGLH